MLWPKRMRDLWAWEPMREMRRLQGEMARLFGDLWPLSARRTFPHVNIWTGRDEAVVTAELPGVTPADLDLSVVGDTLTITASREPEKLEQDQNYIRQERPAGKFTRTIQLPFRVEPDKVQAEYAKGVLRVALPRLEADRPKQITVSPTA